MGIQPQPRDLAELLEIDPAVPGGEGDRFSGYGVMGMPYTGGHVLAFRRFPASSLGYGYSSVWYRDPAGAWNFWSDNPPEASCARFFGSEVARLAVAPIRLSWPGARRLRVVVGRGEIDWSLEFVSSPATVMLNAVAAALPQRTWRSPRASRAMSQLAGPLLGAGKVTLAGLAPNGQHFVSQPDCIWMVRASTARVEGVELGEAAPLPTQAFLRGFAIPQRGLFMIGRVCFESFDPARHSCELVRPYQGDLGGS